MKEKWKSGNCGYDLTIALLTALLAGIVVFSSYGCGAQKSEEAPEMTSQDSSIIYYCPMHPEVIENKPGKCPEPACMGMDLMIKMADTLLEKVLKPVNQSVLATIKTIKPVYKKMNLGVEVNGYIDFDTRQMNSISSWYSGRIEKLYVKYAYQQVYNGQKLFDVYSPELVSAQENLIYILNNDPAEKGLIESAKQKLIFLGFSNELLNQLMASKKVMMAVPVYSKYAGNIHPIEKQYSEMNTMPPASKETSSSSKEILIKEGMYVMMGQTVFNLVNLDKLAVILQIETEDIPKVQKGSEVEMSIEGSDIKMTGKIDFVDPFFKPGAKNMSARVYIDNSDYSQKVGNLVKAKIRGEEFETLWIPVSALMDLGNKKIVWKVENGNFVAKKVESGLIVDGMVEIADGLTEESEIAMEAHYLIDSEGIIKENEDEE